MSIRLKNKYTGVVVAAPWGFSWTSLFFGPFVPLLRSDVKWAVLGFVIVAITAGLGWFVMPFVYNKFYIKELIEKGYIPADDISKQKLIGKNIIADDLQNEQEEKDDK